MGSAVLRAARRGGRTACVPVVLLAGVLVLPTAGAALAQDPPGETPRQEEELPVETVEAPAEAPAEPPAPAVEEPAAAGGEPVIRKIEIRSDAPVGSREELKELITLRPGEPLNERDVRRSLRNLQTSGSAYEVELWLRPVEPPPEGAGPEAPEVADAVVVLRATIQVEAVSVEGDLGRLGRREAERELPLTAGQTLVESRVVRGVFRLQELFERRGYLDASVRLDVDVDEARKRARVTYRVDAGPRARVGAVDFEGELAPFQPQDLREHLGLEAGDAYRAEAVRQARERLQGWLVEEGYRRAEVRQPRVRHGGPEEPVEVVVPVTVGPRIEVEIAGVSRERLVRNDLVPFLGEQGYDEALVLQAVDRVRRYFQEEGHWQVEVDWEEQSLDGVTRLRFEVRPGPVFTLQEVRFEGNQAVSNQQLAELMETTERRLLTLGSGRLVQATLEEDLENIRSYYALQGFRGYEIGPPEVDAQAQRLTLTIPVQEGERRRVAGLDLQGLEALDEAAVREQIPLEPGGPFHPLLLEDTLRIVRGLYETEGFLSAQVSAREEWSEDRTLVDLDVRVIEGPQTVLDRLIVRGNARTRPDVIERAAALESGEPVSRARLLEVERNLYELGIFSRVEVELGPADLSEPTRDVVVRVTEGRPRRVSYGVGYSTDDGLAGLLGYSHRNLFGRALTFQGDLRFGERDRLFRGVLDQPDFTRYNIPMLYTVAHQEQELEAYEVERSVAQVEAVYRDGDWRYGLALDYRIVNSTLTVSQDPEERPGEVIERRDQDIRISSLVPNLFVDRRNDPIAPTEGWTGTARLQWAFPIAEITEADFLKTFLQHTRYFELAYGHFAGSLRLGAIEPLTDLTEDLPGTQDREPINLQIPIDERFFAGGDFSHRAYDRDELGIPGQTLFADGTGRGGTGLILANLEYRFPAYEPVWGAVFLDTGNVWPDWRDVELSEIKSGLGLEVRYLSPIGAVRAGVGYKLDPDPIFEDDRYHVYLAVGNPF